MIDQVELSAVMKMNCCLGRGSKCGNWSCQKALLTGPAPVGCRGVMMWAGDCSQGFNRKSIHNGGLSQCAAQRFEMTTVVTAEAGADVPLCHNLLYRRRPETVIETPYILSGNSKTAIRIPFVTILKII